MDRELNPAIPVTLEDLKALQDSHTTVQRLCSQLFTENEMGGWELLRRVKAHIRRQQKQRFAEYFADPNKSGG